MSQHSRPQLTPPQWSQKFRALFNQVISGTSAQSKLQEVLGSGGHTRRWESGDGKEQEDGGPEEVARWQHTEDGIAVRKLKN